MFDAGVGIAWERQIYAWQSRLTEKIMRVTWKRCCAAWAIAAPMLVMAGCAGSRRLRDARQ